MPTLSYYILIIIVIPLICIAFYTYLRREGIKSYFLKQIDAYIHKYHSDRFIHIDLIKDTMVKHMAHRERQIREECAADKRMELDAQALNFHIMETGWISEITQLEKQLKEGRAREKSKQQFYFDTQILRKELSIMANKNKEIVQEVTQNMTKPLGKLEALNDDLNKAEIKNIPEELKPLKIDSVKQIGE